MKATEQVVMEEVGSLPGSILGGDIDFSDGLFVRDFRLPPRSTRCVITQKKAVLGLFVVFPSPSRRNIL